MLPRSSAPLMLVPRCSGAFQVTPLAALFLSALEVLATLLLGTLLVLQAAVLLRAFLLVVALTARRLISLLL